MVSRRDYTDDAVGAAKMILLEVHRLLGEYLDSIVVIGGWVPFLTIPQDREEHVGSIDIDLALDHKRLQEAGYSTIRELLEANGYEQVGQSFRFKKKVTFNDRVIEVELDLLSGEYEGTDEEHSHQEMQDIRAIKIRGCDLVFDIYTKIELEGELPSGSFAEVTIRVAGIVSFLTLKGNALQNRSKAKDAYDIVYCVRNFPGGIDAIESEFKNWLSNALVQEGMRNIAKNFKSVDHIGPQMVADFEDPGDDELVEIVRRQAYESVNELLTRLGFEDQD